jgi:hypothetical protein
MGKCSAYQKGKVGIIGFVVGIAMPVYSDYRVTATGRFYGHFPAWAHTEGPDPIIKALRIKFQLGLI